MSDWQTVPKVPTRAMLDVVAVPDQSWPFNDSVMLSVYVGMISAAPPPPAVRVTPQMIEAGMKADLHVGRDEVEAILRAAFAVSFPIQQDA